MRIASVADVKAKLSAYVKDSSDSPVIITRNGKAVAAIVPLEDEDDLERLVLGYSPKLRSILAAARRRIRSGRGIPHNQFWRDAQSAARAKSRKPAH